MSPEAWLNVALVAGYAVPLAWLYALHLKVDRLAERARNSVSVDQLALAIHAEAVRQAWRQNGWAPPAVAHQPSGDKEQEGPG